MLKPLLTNLTSTSLKFVPKGPINNCPSLVQMKAWRLPGDKPLSEPIESTKSTFMENVGTGILEKIKNI